MPKRPQETDEMLSLDPNDWLETNGGVHENVRLKWWVARILGPHDKYQLERDFLTKTVSRSSTGKTETRQISLSDISVGSVLEVRGDNWSRKRRRLVHITDIDPEDGETPIRYETVDKDEALDLVEGTNHAEAAELRRRIQKTANAIHNVDALEALYKEAVEQASTSDGELPTEWGVNDWRNGAECDCRTRGRDPAPFTIDEGSAHDGETACENCGGFIR